MVRAARTPVANPTFQTTGIIHRPPQSAGVAGTNYSSAAWSGLGVTGSAGYFKANNSYVVGSFSQVPPIDTGVEDCSYGPYIASIWVGMDGYAAASNDILQAGINAVACGSSAYYAWFEWWTADCSPSQYACGETAIGGFNVNKGDTIVVVVTYYTTSPNGSAYLVDYTTGEYTTVYYNEPTDTYPYQGDTAEWIVERPVNSSTGLLYNLTDYESFSMEGTYNGYLPGSGPESGPDYFTMVCPPWNPSSACPNNSTTLSYVSSYSPSSGNTIFTPAGPVIQYH